MNAFDTALLHFVNGFAHRSWTADHLVLWLNGDGFQKGGLVMLLFWWVWFKQGENWKDNRDTLICVAFASAFGIMVARTVSFILPFRPRPIHSADLHLNIAYGMTQQALMGWSSFPSDHAVVFFTFVAGFFFISRRLGLFVLLYVLLGVCLPRVYLGLHAPTDILAGAALGVGVAYLVCLPKVKSFLVVPVHKWRTKHLPSFYACFFFCTDQVANMFLLPREILANTEYISKTLSKSIVSRTLMLTAFALARLVFLSPLALGAWHLLKELKNSVKEKEIQNGLHIPCKAEEQCSACDYRPLCEQQGAIPVANPRLPDQQAT